jgi:hypothetical protein
MEAAAEVVDMVEVDTVEAVAADEEEDVIRRFYLF